MQRKLNFALAALSAFIMVAISGCQPNTSSTPKAASAAMVSGGAA